MSEGYFDYAASAPPFAEALARQQEVAAKLFASPSSTHGGGRRAKEILDGARKDILRLLGCPDATLVLTSGATEANNLVIRSAMDADGRLLLAADVHPSAGYARDRWPKRVDDLPVGPDGRLREMKPGPKTALVSVLHGNNETGVVHALKDPGVPLHVDATQTAGHLPLDVPFTYLTFSAHKFGGPRGVGGVVVRKAALAPQIEGGGQERGARGGTENVAGLAAAAVALEASLRMRDAETARLRGLARQLQAELSGVASLVANSDPETGLPGLVSVSLPDLPGETVVQEMDLRGFAISAGAACGSGRMEPSRVILAMGRSKALALGTLRVSMGRLTTEASMNAMAAALKDVVKKLRDLK
ncbi:MAG TPA: aminotransferase class V-fold PLP-dependent enzyme [Planctomycetota bacterium]